MYPTQSFRTRQQRTSSPAVFAIWGFIQRLSTTIVIAQPIWRAVGGGMAEVSSSTVIEAA